MWVAIFLVLASAAEIDDIPAYEDLLPNVKSFSTTKKRVYDIYNDHPTTFYCGCSFEAKVVDLNSCDMANLTGARSLRTEVEHIVPASTLSQALGCVGNRTTCQKENPAFKAAHNDLHNLTPAVGTINLARSNNSFGIIEGEQRSYGACDFERDLEEDLVEPAPDVRGDIARTYFYVSWLYGVPLPHQQRRIFLSWNLSDPVDEWERERDRRISDIQGNHNPFVVNP